MCVTLNGTKYGKGGGRNKEKVGGRNKEKVGEEPCLIRNS